MSTLKIGLPVASEYVACYVCEIDTMLGDCDDDKTVELVVALDQVDRLVAVLATIRRTDSSIYHLNDEFREFFVDHHDESGDNPNAVEWPHEFDYDSYYAYQYHRYYWYDEVGRKYEASLIESP